MTSPSNLPSLPRISGLGPTSAKIMIVGEAPGQQELESGLPFSGSAGRHLASSLLQVGIRMNECYLTYAYKSIPPGGAVDSMIAEKKKDITPHHKLLHSRMVLPALVEANDELWREVAAVQPNLILVLGNLPLLFLTGEWGITSWRGSVFPTCSLPEGMDRRPKVLPTYPPGSIFANPSWQPIFLHDLAKAHRQGKFPELPPIRESFLVAPTYETTLSVLSQLHTQLEKSEIQMKLSVDIETRMGHMTCLGIAWNSEEALCIPFTKLRSSEHYWPEEQEATIAFALYKVLTHPKAGVIGQNFQYDCQYIHRWLHFVPTFLRDTMITQHTLFPSLPKSLDFLSSMYRENHIYWKHENESWEYNCRDCTITYEVDTKQQAFVDSNNLRAPHDFQQSLFIPVLATMLRGIRFDSSLVAQFAIDLQSLMLSRQAYLNDVCGEVLNIRSSAQMQRFFYETLGQGVVKSRKTGNATTDDEALGKISKREPLLLPITKCIADLRSMGVFYSTYVSASTDIDGRMRCTFNIAGTDTFRFSSAKNAFGSGMNLQNIPTGDEDGGLPNIRFLFVPDLGMIFFDIDLSSADLRIVTWESGEEEMKAMFREGLDPYTEIAKEFYRDPSISKKDPRRQLFKSFAHGTNYLGTAKGLAERLGLSIHESERTQKWYFGKFPKIKAWQDKIKWSVRTKKMVENVWGYRFHYFDRITDNTFNEAAAWIPQSTVAILINKAYVRIHNEFPEAQILLQVHDSLAGQFPAHLGEWAEKRIVELAENPLPYPNDPMIIPVGVKTSRESWGKCG